jgi:hypothetical protein
MERKDGFNPSDLGITRMVRSEVRSVASEQGGTYDRMRELSREENPHPGPSCELDRYAHGADDNQGQLHGSSGEWGSRDFGPEDNSSGNDDERGMCF